MAKIVRGALQLGLKIKIIGFVKPAEQIARPMSSAAKKDYIKPGYDFGHGHFGEYYKKAHKRTVPIGSDGLPVSVDWSEIPGCVWPAPDQEEKGLCFMFASMGSVRSVNFLKTGELYDPATQQIIDCATMAGCDCGGQPQLVLKYIVQNGGVLRADDYKPHPENEQGHCKRNLGEGIIIDDWKFINPKCEASLKYAVAYQPVVVSINASSRGIQVGDKKYRFDQYKGGIIDGPPSYKLDHSALLVGYGQDEISKKLFWLLLNSYNLWWGRLGFFKISRGVKLPVGTLGILREPVVPLKWSPNGLVLSKCESCSNSLRCCWETF